MTFLFHDMDEITEKLYLGNIRGAENIDKIKKLGIKKVLSLIEELLWPVYKESDNIIHKKFTIYDFEQQNIIKYFGECINFIDGEEKVLVHCMAGASRSASVVIAYLMWKEKKSFKDALDFVSNKRSSVFPNDGFKDQLKLFEKLLKENDYDLNKINFNEIKWNKKLNDYNWNL